MNILLIIFGAAIVLVGLAFFVVAVGVLASILPAGSYLGIFFVTLQTKTTVFLAAAWLWIQVAFTYFQAISLFVCVLLLMGVIYSKFMLYENKKAKKAAIAEAARKEAELSARVHTKEKDKWKIIESHEKSENPSDWRLAILECDILLNDLLEKLGYQGDTLGERLRAVPRDGMATLDSAWEAHKIRNAIAHEGSQFTLTKVEASRVINLYQSVFQEFDFI